MPAFSPFMSKPYIHSLSSVRKFGGTTDDYLPIHNFLDSSKAVITDSRHRALTHNAWFIGTVLELVFGTTVTNADGKVISVRDIGEQHVFEDLGCIPTAQDYLEQIELQPWMESGGQSKQPPPSHKKLKSVTRSHIKKLVFD